MKPRHSSSKKWTSFPKEYIQQIESVFFENFEPNLVDRKLIVEGQIFPSEIMLRVGFIEKGSIRQVNFEVSVDYSKDQQDAVERIYDCLDAAASMMADYFENEENMNFPLTWKEYDFKGHKVYLQHSTVNSDLEKKANALLGVDDESLVKDEDLGEDALDRAEEKIEAPSEEKPEDEWESTASIDEDDEDDDIDTTKPSLFSKKKPNPKKNKLH